MEKCDTAKRKLLLDAYVNPCTDAPASTIAVRATDPSSRNASVPAAWTSEPATPRAEARTKTFRSPTLSASLGMATAHGDDRSMMRPSGALEIEPWPASMRQNDAEDIWTKAAPRPRPHMPDRRAMFLYIRRRRDGPSGWSSSCRARRRFLLGDVVVILCGVCRTRQSPVSRSSSDSLTSQVLQSDCV